MALQIRKMLTKLFGSSEYRLLILGFDASGKTAILYKLKLNEFVQTIPTIGFNVETVTHGNVNLTIWDVGGCDKIRPLLRHYFENTKGIIFVIDSQDGDRQSEVKEELWRLFSEDALSNLPMLIYLNKIDIGHGLSRDCIIQTMKLHEVKYRQWLVQPCSAKTGDGLYDGLSWLVQAMKSPASYQSASTQGMGNITSNPMEKHFEENSLQWLAQTDDDTSEEFIERLEKRQVEHFDHRTMLRMIWSYLKINGRKKAIESVFATIKLYVNEANETLTYFWIQIVHYALESTTNSLKDFSDFLLINPQLLNEMDLPLSYYRKETLFSDEAKKSVILPDIKPLPSILPSSVMEAKMEVAKKLEPAPVEELNDDDFLNTFESCTLTNWSHKTHLRMAWLYLTRNDRRIAVNKIFDGIKKFIEHSNVARKTTFHFTMTYFWIQMIDLAVAQSPKDLDFEAFLGRNSHLMNGGLFLEYYRKETLLNNPIARQEMVLPDIKPLPTIVSKRKI